MRLRRRGTLALAGALAVGAFALWLTAPALSLRPYVPRAVDFELRSRLPTSALASASGGAVALRSKVLRAPKRFNLVGLRWHGARDAAVRVRARRAGGKWTRWIRLAADPHDSPDRTSREWKRGWSFSDPLWVGEADEVQYRFASARRPRDVTLHFVNAKGTATALDRIETRLRRVAHGAVGAVASLFGGRAEAQLTKAQPAMVSREAWGAAQCPPRAKPEYGAVKLAFVHHTVTANTYAPEDAPSIVLAICRYHRNSNGWNDIGYQFLVDRYGQIFEGRAGGIDRAVVGAQAQGYNSQSTGIANLGTFSTQGQTAQGLAALARLLSWKLAVHGVPPTGTVVLRSGGGSLNRYPAGVNVRLERISGHRDGDATACPGDGLYAQLPTLREMVSPDPRAPASAELTAARTHIAYGRKARLAGALRAGDGSPLFGRPIQIQSLGAGVRTLATVTTRGDGSFSKNLKLAFNRTLQARFAGDVGLRPALSSAVRIGVRTRVSLTAAVAESLRLKRGQRLAVRGAVRPRKRTAFVLVDRRGGDGAFRRVAKKKLRVSRGRVASAVRLSRAGVFRIRLGVAADARNLGGRSEPVVVTVG
jgi:hypothetical protein